MTDAAAEQILANQAPAGTPAGGNDEARLLQIRTAAMKELVTPLLSALYEVQGSMGQTGEATGEANLKLLEKLLENTTTIAAKVSETLGAGQGGDHDWVRWGVATGVSQCVSVYYRATSKPLPPAEAEGLLGAFAGLERRFPGLMPVGPEHGPVTLGLFRARLLEAFAPLVHAVATYSFSRPEHALIAEIAERILQASEMVTRALATPGMSPEEWRQLAWSCVKAAADLYYECHWAEADRLLYMDPDERAAYFAEHGQQVPMDKVWRDFDQRLGMLTTLIAYIEIPQGIKDGGEDDTGKRSGGDTDKRSGGKE